MVIVLCISEQTSAQVEGRGCAKKKLGLSKHEFILLVW